MARLPVHVEVCVDSVESAVVAIKGGATRLELCGNLGIGGGTTPSIGLLRSVKRALPEVEIMAMVRPRIGDFLYTDLELEVMLEDVRLFKDENVTGVVFGVLCADGNIDTKNARRLVEAAIPMQVCFHRAFDMTPDPVQALKDIETVGVTRILTSGHGKYAPESLETLSLIASLAIRMQPPITILPGSGINVGTIRAIASSDWWKEFREVHLSAGHWIDSTMQFRKEGMGMGLGGAGEWGIWRTDTEVVSEVRRIAECIVNESS